MLYLEHKFIINKMNLVAAVAVSRMCFGKLPMDRILKDFPGGDVKPEYPERLRIWIQALETSSKEIL